MKIKHKVWIEKDDEIIMGMGREALLRAIKETGSITKAAEKVGLITQRLCLISKLWKKGLDKRLL
jgi:N-terminal domain of molybdenum-binding protein